MKKINYALLAIAVFLVPLVARTLWFYHGVNPPRTIEIPDYAALSIPTLPLSTPIPNQGAEVSSRASIVIDYSHGNMFAPSEIEPLVNLLTSMGAQVRFSSYNTDLSDELHWADGYIIISPSYPFSEYERMAIGDFIAKGGRMLVIGDPTRNNYSYAYYGTSTITSASVDILNQITAQYGITFQNDYAYNLVQNEGNFRNIYANPASASSLGQGISQVVLYSTLTLVTNGSIVLSSSKDTLSSLTDQGGDLVLAALSANDQILALGDMTFMTEPYLYTADNQVLLRNVVGFTDSSIRPHMLSDFPYVLSGSVVVLLSTETGMDSGLLAALASLQSFFATAQVELQIGNEPSQVQDLIVLGMYPPADDIRAYVDPFRIDFSGGNDLLPTEEVLPEESSATPFPDYGDFNFNTYFSSSSMNVPGLGSIPASRMGLVLHAEDNGHNVLILLADTSSNLTNLVNSLSYNGLSGCLVFKNVAACPVGSSYSNGY
jgi:hypothetical protein